jgi:hypothetical protein
MEASWRHLFNNARNQSSHLEKASGGTRTHNLRFTKPLLCQLSYTGDKTNDAAATTTLRQKQDRKKTAPGKTPEAALERFRQQPTFTPLGTIIGLGNLNHRVRNGSGVCHQVWSPENPRTAVSDAFAALIWQCI